MIKVPYVSIAILFLLIFIVYFGGYFYDVSAYLIHENDILLPPSLIHPFGTDRLGRDILARIIEGGKISLDIGIASSFITSFIGLGVGISAGFFQKTTDKIIVVIIDLFLTFPTFFLLLALVSYINASVWVLIFVISVTGWMGMARMIRSESFEISSKPYIKILSLAKVSKIKIIFKYFVPLLAPIFFISFTFGVGGAILAESGLSFLGIGITPPQMSWGTILNEGKEVIDIAWWVSFFPGLCIFLVIFALVNISDYLQHKTNQKESFGV